MDYTKLEVWRFSRKLANCVYDLTDKFPHTEKYGLSNQLRRAAISVCSNIAEGCGRRSDKETLHFLSIARGSLFEIETQVYLALDRNYLTDQDFNITHHLLQDCKKLINGLIKHLNN